MVKEDSQLRIRNKCIRKVRVADIEDAPWNFRTHPELQKGALNGVIQEIGFYGYPDVYETESGALRLCDGHLRKSLLIETYGSNTEIEVNVTDFDEAEAKLATATHDPIAAMATVDASQLDDLLRDVQTGNEDLAAMLTQLASDAGILPPDFEPESIDDQPRLDEKAKVECPECGHEFTP